MIPRERGPGNAWASLFSLDVDIVVESPLGETVEVARGVRQGVCVGKL